MVRENDSIVVPASSANLGCGFDCGALTLSLYMRVRGHLEATPGFRIRYSGPHPERVPLDDSNLVVRAARSAAERIGVGMAGGEIEIENEIPIAAGLGSSAAAIVAGILLAARQFGEPPDPMALLALACRIEGHPDNVAAAWHGGLVVAAPQPDGQVRVARAALPEDLQLIAVVPDFQLTTARARAVLPARYDRADAVHNLQRFALLVATCFSGEFRLAPELFLDRLHQPFRAPLVPGLEACFALRHPDLLGVFLSGAGSAVLALARASAAEIGDRLASEFMGRGVNARVFLLRPENRGARDFLAGRAADS
jgi:homoserine kinase